MSRRLHLLVTLAVSAAWAFASEAAQAQVGIEYSLRSETALAGAFVDPVVNRTASFDASVQDGELTVRVDLLDQAVTVRRGHGELHIDSTANVAGMFGTLSDDERAVLERLATLVEQDPETQTALQSAVACVLRSLSAWPAAMPLAVSVDAVMKTVGDVTIPMEEIREAHRQAMDDLRVQSPEEKLRISAAAITSLCTSIGKTRTACYPTSLVPYRETCESVLLGGTTCRGRCGTTCNGLCTEQRYTQDCHNHDRCADIYGTTHRYCDFIFNSTFDDCASAPDCVDFPGVWKLTYKWVSDGQTVQTTWNVQPNGTFNTGTWTATDTSAKLTYTAGCKPVYTGTLSTSRLTASGTMKCTTGTNSGTWSASKTNGILP